MPLEFSWRTRAGRRTEDNRDYAGVGVRAGEALCILLDGSTCGRGSGELVRDVARAMVDGFLDGTVEPTGPGLSRRLRELHGELTPGRPQASASYLLVHVTETGAVLAAHAGDCLLGRREPGGALSWLNSPDTLANVLEDRALPDIASDPARHRITRSFRAREFHAPTILNLGGEPDLVLATDGFWADLGPEEQTLFIQGASRPDAADADDCSVLRVRAASRKGDPEAFMIGQNPSIYVRTA